MLQWQYFLKLENIIRVWYIYYLAIVEAVSLVSPFFPQTLHTQHLANGVFQPCAVLRLCSDTEGRIVPQINKEIVLHAVLACILWGLAFEAQTVMFCRAKGEFVGAAGWRLWQDPRGEVVCCTALHSPWATFPPESQLTCIQRPVLVRDPLCLIEHLEGVSGSGYSWAVSYWRLEEYSGKA